MNLYQDFICFIYNAQMKKFDEWNVAKKDINSGINVFYKIREIWWCRLGVNIGFEEDGKGKNHERPVLILRGFSRQVCLVVPLTTSTKVNPYYIQVGMVDGKPASAIISQIRLIDTKRFLGRVEILDIDIFNKIRKAIKNMI